MQALIKQVSLKVTLFLAVFLVLHFAYDWYPAGWVAMISATKETFLQHAKVGVIAWTLISTGEYLLVRKQTGGKQVLFSRLAAALLLPWLMFLLFYTVPVFLGQPFILQQLETGYAVLITLLTGIGLSLLEHELENAVWSAFLRWSVTTLYLLLLALMVILTFRVPAWLPFF